MINGEEMPCWNSSVLMLMIFMVINDDDVVIAGNVMNFKYKYLGRDGP